MTDISQEDLFKNFSNYTRRQDIARFLVRNELFKKIIKIKGSIIECGVHQGGGLMTFAHLSSIYEPYNYSRKIIGFDTFKGFKKFNTKKGDLDDFSKKKLFKENFDTYDNLKKCIKNFNDNRFINNKEKIILIKGDASKTIPKFLNENKHSLVSLLYLDFDVYSPTVIAISNFIKRMSKGSIIAFDQVNNPDWPGETVALLESINIQSYKLSCYSYEPNISYITL